MNAATRASLRRWLFLGAAVALAIAASLFVPALNYQREELGLTGYADTGEVSPGLALLVTASGPARAVAINILWLRATRLQEEGEYFELNELYRMITALEPRLPMVWAFAAWNLAYNVSVKFPADQPQERWRWITNGIETLRDRGIPYNPKAAYLYRELAWIYDHKIGQTSDEAHMYYKVQLAQQMQDVLGTPPYDERLRAIADAPRHVSDLARPVRDLMTRLETAGVSPLTRTLDVLNRVNLPDDAVAVLDRAAGTPELARLEAFLRGYYLRTKLRLEPGGAELSLGDILDWQKLAQLLVAPSQAQQPAPSPAGRVWDLLPEEIQKTMEFLAQGNAIDEPARRRVVAALNAVLARRDFYQQAAFDGVALPPVVRAYLGADRAGLDERQLVTLNRALLHITFPRIVPEAGLMLRLTRWYGPIDWRLPDAHALYWASAGRDVLGLSVEKAANTDRVIFHALASLYRRGRLRFVPATKGRPALWMGSPHFAFIPSVIEIYEETLRRYPDNQDPIKDGYLNFLRQVTVDFFVHNDLRSSLKYFNMLKERGGERGSLENFVVKRTIDDMKTAPREHVRNMIQALLYRSLLNASLGDMDTATGFENLSRLLHTRYNAEHADRLTLPPLREIWKRALRDALRTFPTWQIDKLRELFPKEVKEAEEELRKEAERRQRERRERGPASGARAPSRPSPPPTR